MTVVIIEDEALAAERLSRFVKEYDAAIEIKACLDTVRSAVAWFEEKGSPDLILLDIELGDGKSFEIFKEVEVTSHIIFVTAFNEYAIQAFKYNSIDYLLKPLVKEELFFALDKYKAQTSNSKPVDLTALIEQLQPKAEKEYKSRFLVKKGSRYFSIEAANVAHIYTRERVHYIKTFDGVDYIIENNLDVLEEQLSPAIFFRVNRQFIVNYTSVKEVITWFDGKLKLMIHPAPYEEIIISRLKAGDFKNWLNK
ncbi:LytR/AlgR family response regulator transcription factor [Longitalea luteola]|uniref:LytR/AlgR family response regulator transcription factor n=1 Tax=Longitalea luteola TaxID=2812563 RepID=UPI001A97882D|nr:LytTR family DNA-binding domain-containing protein [Longitalea luteola]